MNKKQRPKRDLYLKNVGLTIKDARKEKGMSQESLALTSGLDRSYIGGVERGERNVSIINLKKIADSLGITISNLLNGV